MPLLTLVHDQRPRSIYDLGIKSDDKEEVWLQVWATTPEYKDTLIVHLTEEQRKDPEGSCNWTDHGHPRLFPRFPGYLPLSLFIDEQGKLKQDGDKVIIYHNNAKTKERIKIELTLNQRSYRYGHCGADYFDGEMHDGGFANCVMASRDYPTLIAPVLLAKVKEIAQAKEQAASTQQVSQHQQKATETGDKTLQLAKKP